MQQVTPADKIGQDAHRAAFRSARKRGVPEVLAVTNAQAHRVRVVALIIPKRD